MKSKKIFLIYFIILSLLGTSLSINFYLYNINKKAKTEILEASKSTPSIYNYLNSITINNFEEKVLSEEEFYIYIGRPDCGDCMLFEPMFENVIEKYNLYDKIYYLNVKHFKETNSDQWKSFKNKYGFTQTPAIIHFKNAENISIIEWNEEKGLSENIFLDWLKNNNLIK